MELLIAFILIGFLLTFLTLSLLIIIACRGMKKGGKDKNNPPLNFIKLSKIIFGEVFLPLQ